jgi:hypothetical protein
MSRATAALRRHFKKYARYYAGVDTQKMYAVADEMIALGASETEAASLTHGLAHDIIAQRRTARSSPRATAQTILSGRVQLCPHLSLKG